jgi:monomeric sarcosine oxidase
VEPFDVVVIGAGLTGSMVARSIAARGRSVLVLEAYEPGHAGGSSHGSSRGFRRGQTSSRLAGMAARSLDLWRDLESDSGEELLRLTGAIDFGVDRRPRDLVRTFREMGVEAELLTAEEAGHRWPQLDFPTEVVHHAEAGVLNPATAIRAALQLASRDGAVVKTGTEVTAVAGSDGDLAVRAADTEYRAGHVVVAVGPWLPRFLAGGRVPFPAPSVTVSSQSVYHFETVDGSDDWPLIIAKHGGQHYAIPSGSDTGGIPTIKIGLHDLGRRLGPGQVPGPDLDALRAIQNFVRAFVPDLRPDPVRADTCFYTSTADEAFVLDRLDGVTLASPCSGQGAKFAPLVGEIVAGLALHETRPDPAFSIASDG